MAKHFEQEFPRVAARYQKYAKQLGIRPLFGPFFNWCINAPHPDKEIKWVHCQPHVDAKNLAIGVCILWIYGEPGPSSTHTFFHQFSLHVLGKFDSKSLSWLVIWEAGIIIELPPGVFLMYPSSLFFHFNIDMEDMVLFTLII
jgi:hypothetical protein